MIAKFRWHKGGLEESMATTIEDTPDNIRKEISSKTPGVITSKFYCMDRRINWETYLVLVDDVPVGFSNKNIFPEKCHHCDELTYRIGGYCSRDCEGC